MHIFLHVCEYICMCLPTMVLHALILFSLYPGILSFKADMLPIQKARPELAPRISPRSSLRFTPRGMRNSVILNLLVVAVGIVFFMGDLVAVAPRDPLGQGQRSQLGSP